VAVTPASANHANDANQMMLLLAAVKGNAVYQMFQTERYIYFDIQRFARRIALNRTDVARKRPRPPSQAEGCSLQASISCVPTERFDSLQRLNEVDSAIVNELCSTGKVVVILRNPEDLSGMV
jgi:hypothetical protein